MPEGTMEMQEGNEQDRLFKKSKEALETEDMEAFFGHLETAMAGLGEADAVAWQQLSVEIYAAGIKKLGREEMDQRWDERTGDPDTREWMFGHL